ncbi:hypothetical protein HII36_31645 [Nonomuraea sp. NN258]|uniref:hypothetical protein n=1 Tax=Nonomuraea antri TaxID=2730852 RepID=UPI001567D3A4|nr:hypothetical protein [Nonomuraea antri]NRQ36356.1 hypothetical protein [Nonomuraea antri]
MIRAIRERMGTGTMWVLITAGGLAVALLIWLIVIPALWGGPDYCEPGSVRRVEVTTAEGVTRTECVGVSGTYAFDPSFDRVMKVLAAENEFAVKGGPGTYYTIAFLGPLTQPEPRVLHQLEGAVTALNRANRTALVGARPLIKMVLANTDSQGGNWEQTTRDLLAMEKSPDRLVAVAGLGRSDERSLSAMKLLATRDFGMVSDVVTADGIDMVAVPGFVRVNPRVGEQINVLNTYLRSTGKVKTASLVRSKKPGDHYADALAAGFKNTMKDLWEAGGSVEYPFSAPPGNEWDLIRGNLCGRATDVIFYAGRGADLPAFLQSLHTGNQQCHTKPITIVTGSDTVRLRQDESVREALENISVVYSPLVEPSVLKCGTAPAQFIQFERAYVSLGFKAADLGTGWGIMAHDSVVTAVAAIRRAAGQQGDDPVTPADVAEMLPLFQQLPTAVPGASGSIMFNGTTGNRVGFELPVLKLVSGGPPKVLAGAKPC